MTDYRRQSIIDSAKRRLIIGLLITAAGLGLVFGRVATAQEPIQQTEITVVDNVRSRCDSLQSSLGRLHTSDALLRVNVGQTYNSISVRLMARLNSRLALNRIDSLETVEIANRFDQLRVEFAANYNDYETAMSSLVKIDCKQKPAEFYAQLLTTRDLRLRLAETVKLLNGSISDYRTAVERVKSSLGGGSNEG